MLSSLILVSSSSLPSVLHVIGMVVNSLYVSFSMPSLVPFLSIVYVVGVTGCPIYLSLYLDPFLPSSHACPKCCVRAMDAMCPLYVILSTQPSVVPHLYSVYDIVMAVFSSF